MPLVTPLRPDDLRRVGRYRLSGRVADGLDHPDSAGTFLSRLPDGTPVAVTLLARAAAPDSASRDRFTAEATVARRVAPFCAARILDAGFDGDQPFLVSEFIEGPSLAETVAAEGPLEGPVLAALAIGAATGLTSIHQAGLVHGDFGPDHVVLGTEGPRVVHFSTTPPYGPATPSADLMAWAQTILFAAGRPDVASLPEQLRNTVSACMSADPASRPPARTLVTALLGHNDPAAGLLAEGTRRARAAGRGPVSPASDGPAEAATVSRSRKAAWAAACLACVGVIVVAATLIATHRNGPGTAATPVAADHTTASAHTSSAAPVAHAEDPGRPGGHLERNGPADGPGARGDRPDQPGRGDLLGDDLLPAARLLGPAAAGLGAGRHLHPGAGHHEGPAELRQRHGAAQSQGQLGPGVQVPPERRSEPGRRAGQVRVLSPAAFLLSWRALTGPA